MALITSAASGNFSAGATWTGGVVPGVGDEARASTGHTITINANAICDEVSNAGTGLFTLNDGVTLTANVTPKSTTASRNLLQVPSGLAYIVGNVIGGPTGVGSSVGVSMGGGSLTITGNVTGGGAGSSIGVRNTQAGTLTITGNVTGSATSDAFGVQNSISGNVIVTGIVTGGAVNSSANGINNVAGGTITVTGLAIGGNISAGITNSGTGTVAATRAKGNAYGPGNTSGLAAAVGIANSGLGIIEVEQLEFGTNGMSPVSGTGIRLKKANTNVAVFNYCDTAGAKTLIDATANAAMPATTDVRSGVSYASGALTGSCAVPAAGSTALGVPVDAGFGTAVLTPEAVWGAGTRTITGGTVDTLTNAPASVTPSDIWDYATRTITGGTVTTLTNAPTVPTPSQIASQVRTELSVELGRVDQAISSRATPGDIPTESEIAAEVWAKPTTELTITGSIGERAKNQSTVSTTGAQLAAALS